MKRSLIIVVAILILLVLAGCLRPQEQEELLIEEFSENEIQFELVSVSGLKSSYKIVVKGELLATVHAWIEDDSTLFLRFEAFDGWLLLESRAATSTTLTGMPKNKDGKTDPSLFSGEVHITPLKEYTLSLPLGKLSDGQKVYFGTYSEFRKVGTRTRVKYGVCINSFVYHDDTPVIDKKPKLEGDIDDPLVRGFTYDWEIEKSVDPESVELKLGESATITYTINATRTPVDGSFSLFGAVNLNSTGELPASSIEISVMLQYLLGDEYTDLEGFTAINLDTSATPTLNPGESSSYKYDFGFDPKEGVDEYRILASITADDIFPFTLDATFTLSGLAESTDATATIADQLKDIESVIPGGFSAAYVPPTTGSWVLEQPGDGVQTFSLVYEVLLTNEKIEDPQQDFYILDNTATLTEYDSKTEHSDDARVIITVPQESEDILELTVEVSGEFGWEETVRYGWEIDKSVDPSSAELSIGEEEDFEYTLTATRSVEETTALATITGKATVENTGSLKAEGVSLVITLQYYDGEWKDLESKGPFALGDMEVGDSEEKDYEFNFDPTGKSKFRVLATATSGSYSADNAKEFVPGTPEEKNINPSADVEDVFTNFSDFKAYGFSVDPDDPDRSWDDIINHTDWVQADSNTWKTSYTITVKNEEAEEDLEGYYLYNTVTIYKSGTDEEYDSDDEEIKIIVTETVKLKAEVEAEFFWIRENIYEWEIDKKANPTLIIFQVNEFEKEIDYTITATRTLESDVSEHSYQGAVTVTNSGLSEAQNVKLLIELQYYNGTNWITIETLPQVSLGNLASGSSTVHNFGPSVFTPVDVSAEHKITVVASADAPANTADDFYSSMLQITSSETTNATATLDDEFTYIPDGFQIVGTDPDPLPFRKELTDSAIVQFSITLRKFSFDGVGGITYEMGADAYISATVSGYMEGTYPGWCTQVNVSGISGPYTILDIYEGGAPSTQMAKINYILNRFRDGDYPGVDYRHIQLAIWAIMEGSLKWSSWRTMFSPDVPDGDRPIVQAIIDTAEDDFLPGCGDVILISALSSNKQNLILEAVLSCEVQEFTLENTATLVTETDELWDDAVVEIRLTPTDPQVWKEETAWGGNYEGSGSAWWYYFDTNGPATQDIYAGKNKKVAGASVTYKDGKLIIVLGPNMRLKNTDESVKIQGYAEGGLPSTRPEGGHFSYKGSNLVVDVSPARYFAIHLDVEVLK
ncbi:hypothetical protein [Mesotoga sp. B105.6.4]|uniref:hypothetical protein n=1 Tax=Mesotoga sp. B105.6.4 TaxID=1582224 RepID=UPI000CCC3CCF|nr:hypothetical protein [Mesotoga sp. B105.6.4]PNS42619.1 hypothetical protein RJ60_00815 [Mesotoga sp. B105.6.4]